jgi:hypothetical protein
MRTDRRRSVRPKMKRSMRAARRAPVRGQHDRSNGMHQDRREHLKRARLEDAEQLLSLWDLLFDEMDPPLATAWKEHARDWFARHVEDDTKTRLSVIDVQGSIAAAAIGTVELGRTEPTIPPRARCPVGQRVTLPIHRGRWVRDGCRRRLKNGPGVDAWVRR